MMDNIGVSIVVTWLLFLAVVYVIVSACANTFVPADWPDPAKAIAAFLAIVGIFVSIFLNFLDS